MKKNHYVALILIIMSGFMQCTPSSNQDFELQPGDLLFQDGDCGDFCQAIRAVTQGVDGHDFSHVGIVYPSEQSKYKVLEAISEGVVFTPIDQFLQRNRDTEGRPKVVVGRLKQPYQSLIPKALQNGLQYLHKPYDDVFDINNDAYYCSELVYYMFLQANQQQPVFELNPMTFKDPYTGTTFPVWVEYYRNLDQAIPEGQPGLNPGSISRSEKLEIFYPYTNFHKQMTVLESGN
ncbi:MAG: YiiX/YebB-like N1pC/P60 family cysteine hydrolase [Candidatus Cyclobacteriaceae bacterium M3_2C_046]